MLAKAGLRIEDREGWGCPAPGPLTKRECLARRCESTHLPSREALWATAAESIRSTSPRSFSAEHPGHRQDFNGSWLGACTPGEAAIGSLFEFRKPHKPGNSVNRVGTSNRVARLAAQPVEELDVTKQRLICCVVVISSVKQHVIASLHRFGRVPLVRFLDTKNQRAIRCVVLNRSRFLDCVLASWWAGQDGLAG